MTANSTSIRVGETFCQRTDFSCRNQKAIARCKEQIAWYEGQKHAKRRLFRFFQTAVVVLSGLTPLLILWANVAESGDERWLGIGAPSALVQALPAALASMLASILSSYRWREEWVRFGFTAEALKSELVKYTTRTTADYNGDDDAALNTFVTKIESLVSTEVEDWRTLINKQTELTVPEIGGWNKGEVYRDVIDDAGTRGR
jgi:hypothetical protein